MTKQLLKELNIEKLQEIILKMSEIMTEEQNKKLEKIIEEYVLQKTDTEELSVKVRMSQEFVDEKMKQIQGWMNQIDEGELYLNTDGYEDYSNGYWDSEWITDYYDNQGIGDKITSAVRFAKDCIDDRRYREANFIYEWLWEMLISTAEDDGEAADLELLIEEEIVGEDIKQLALLTLYADYQVREPEERAGDIYLYFSHHPFQNIHIEDMFQVGRENLEGTDQFMKDWAELLKTKSGDTESRLLKEAVLYNEGVDGLVKIADESSKTHPSLYLEVMKEYDKNHDYSKMEQIGEKALLKIDSNMIIRSEIALKAAYAASCLGHTENVMRFCWESFRSDSIVRNLLRLFGTKEMAELYGIRAKEVLTSGIKSNSVMFGRNTELRQNIIVENQYHMLEFFTGDFSAVKAASKNPQGSLGWSSCFIKEGICLFLLYLYEKALPTKAAAAVANTVGFMESSVGNDTMDFESEIIEESRKYKTGIFWNYFQRWKHYFPMEQKEKEQYLAWAEKIVHSRAEAIVGGQHRRQYAEVAVLLAMIAEIKEQMGKMGAKQSIFAVYKKKFPRHSAFQAEMKEYFDMRG